MSWTSASWQSARSRSWLTAFVLAGCTMLSTGCGASRLAIPDPTVPHQVAKETEVVIWVRLADGQMTRVPVRLLEGWWIAGPPVVDPGQP
jgi:hypothetical protein